LKLHILRQVDTSSSSIAVYNKPPQTYNLSAVNFSYSICESYTDIDYYDSALLVAVTIPEYNVSFSCLPPPAVASLGAASSTVNYTTSNYFQIENSVLHQWENASGVFGLSYDAYSSSSITPFQSILLNASLDGSRVFGLQLNAAPETNAMQLGGIDAQYSTTLEWAIQGSSSPSSHSIMIQNFSMCGVNLFAQFADVWSVVVDTSSACVVLPAEVYDIFSAWYDNETVIDDIYSAPSFSFKINGGQRYFQIPLFSLLIAQDAIDSEKGAPFVTTSFAGVQRLCVLKGGDITAIDGYDSTPPQVIFGSLALQSLYFAADFSSLSVGFANKYSTDEQEFFLTSLSGCSAPASCVGQQKYKVSKNLCEEPDCDEYFFTTTDQSSHRCVFKNGSLICGVVIISIFALGEIVAYFVVQYSASTLSDMRRREYNHVRIGTFTKEVGRVLTWILDALLFHLFSWARPLVIPGHVQMQIPV
jgi:hypothetical protein